MSLERLSGYCRRASKLNCQLCKARPIDVLLKKFRLKKKSVVFLCRLPSGGFEASRLSKNDLRTISLVNSKVRHIGFRRTSYFPTAEYRLSLGPWNRARKAVLHLEKDSAQKYAESD